MEQRYDLSFMKEYAKLYNKDNRWLAEKFHCGIKIVDKILNGEIKVKEKPMEDILYEFGFSDYDSLKTDIINKTNTMEKEIIKNKIKVRENISYKTNPSEIFDYNSMTNTDRIIVALLCDENLLFSFKQLSTLLNIDEEYIKNVYTNVLSCIKYAEQIEPEYKKIKV